MFRLDLPVKPGGVFGVVGPETGRLLLALLADFFQRCSRLSGQLFGRRLELGSYFILSRQPVGRPTAKNCELLPQQVAVIAGAIWRGAVRVGGFVGGVGGN